ncbi:MAG: circularly permuted type 2 ATP-grasp protein [Akkermansiaceae bacterium]|nr:circularly permuted type 2 ATP-grasp protein [Akkermansiaceae bacterium]
MSMPAQLPTGSAIPPSQAGGLLAGYVPQSGVWDEMLLPGGGIRPHWKAYARFLESVDAEEIGRRQSQMQKLLRDHGVTYNMYDDTRGAGRPWELDLLPLLLPQSEWQSVSVGLAQRARLLNAILADLYGAKTLLKRGLLPPALVHGNPGFLRGVSGVVPPGGKFLVRLGADLVRGLDGRWMVLADRLQAPSGNGYALENRLVLANVHAEEFNALGVRRLSDHYEVIKQMLQSLAPRARGGASIAMYTPGPYNETYFEHALKARYLGYPLVEGADLTVRDRRVHMKTLEGLRRVDVLIRHVDDVFADPLELEPNSMLGVAGLLEAWRSGSVALANGLGTKVVETPALHPFLPGLCRHLLAEELLLPSAPTWWCGQAREREMVLASPDRWVLKPAFVRGARDPIFLADLSPSDKASLLERLRSTPHDWIAQEALPLSTAPTLVRGRLEPRALVWRTFTVAGNDGYNTMPGGLSRVSPEPRRWIVTMRSGGISKDTWIIGDGAETVGPGVIQQAPTVIRPSRPPGAVPSRAADHLFWLGRYAERLETTVRVLRALLQRLFSERPAESNPEIRACLDLLKAMGFSSIGANIRNELREIIRDPKKDGSLSDLLGRIRFNASSARDRLSDDMWRLFNHLDRDGMLDRTSAGLSGAQDLLDSLVLDLTAFSGLQQENMTRGHGWRFLEIGKRIERGWQTLTLLQTASGSELGEEAVLPPLLEICDSSMTYRRMHFSRPSLLPAVDLLLLDESNPRSVAFQLQALGRQSARLPSDPTTDSGGRERQQTDALLSDLSGINLVSMAAAERDPRVELPALCQHLADSLEVLSDLLTEHFFSHAVRRVR